MKSLSLLVYFKVLSLLTNDIIERVMRKVYVIFVQKSGFTRYVRV